MIETMTRRELREVLRHRDGDRCFYCERVCSFEPIYYQLLARNLTPSVAVATIEHLIDVRLGGTDEPTNLRIACQWCNHERGRLKMSWYDYYNQKRGGM